MAYWMVSIRKWENAMSKNGFVRNFSYVMLSNILSMGVSIIVTLLIPHYTSNSTYAYFQLENLYCGYIWLISLGWNDGLYIKYGGIKREKLKNEGISGQFLALFLYILLTAFCLLNISSKYGVSDENKKIVFFLSIISVSIEILTITLTNLLQAVNSMKEYAKVTILDRSLYFGLVLVFLLSGNQDFKILIGIDLAAKCIVFCWTVYVSKDFLFVKAKGVKETLQMSKEAIGIGINITLASCSSRLINNIVQYSIENAFGVIVFGKITLTLSISNMFTKFVAAISAVLFPFLRNTPTEKQEELYGIMATILRTVLLGAFIGYLPLRLILEIWLPSYKDSLHFVALLLPISLYETKVTMLINTYLKTIRQEQKILLSNVITILISVLVSIISVFILKNLELAMLGIVFMLAFRSMLEEYFLGKCMQIQKGMLSEIIMTVVFIVFSWMIDGWIGMLGYVICYIGYLWIQRKEILQAVTYLKK